MGMQNLEVRNGISWYQLRYIVVPWGLLELSVHGFTCIRLGTKNSCVMLWKTYFAGLGDSFSTEHATYYFRHQ
jgi:hypothetical protein